MYPRVTDLSLDLFGVALPFVIYSFPFCLCLALASVALLMRFEGPRLVRAGRWQLARRSWVDDVRRRPEPEPGKVPPWYLLPSALLLSLASGLVGGRIASALETPRALLRNPYTTLLEVAGSNFYGGLILGTLAVSAYLRWRGLSVRSTADLIAPCLFPAYALGRLGCHLSGDGCWGMPAQLADKPWWVPLWLWAETYPRNMVDEFLPPPGVHPTALYEIIATLPLFVVTWRLLYHRHAAGWLFALYFILNGVERFLIELIGTNVRTHQLLGMPLTQAQVVGLVFVAVGTVGVVALWRPDKRPSGLVHDEGT